MEIPTEKQEYRCIINVDEPLIKELHTIAQEVCQQDVTPAQLLAMLAFAYLNTYPYLDIIKEHEITEWIEHFGKGEARKKWVREILREMVSEIKEANEKRLELHLCSATTEGIAFPADIPHILQ